MRSYEQSHPWLQFHLDLSKASPKFWMLLGEAQSKCEHIAGVPLRPKTADELHKIYLAKGIMATTAIEGNTLSEDQVRQRIEGKLELPPSKEYLGQEIDNILKACNHIIDTVTNIPECSSVSIHQIINYNRIVLENLPLSEDVVPGRLRTHEVGVGRYRGAPAQDCEFLLNRLCDFINNEFDCMRLGTIACNLLKAVVSHLYLAWIHPFGDGNGRTARLVEYQILLASGVPSPAAHLLSNHYNTTRNEYYRQLDHSSRSGGDIFPFLQYALQGFVDGLKEQLAVIREQQFDVAWRNYIHEIFRNEKGAGAERQRHLALDLSMKMEPVPLSTIREISPRVAQAYANKSKITLSRDITALIEMGLVVQEDRSLRANREIILSFLPYCKKT